MLFINFSYKKNIFQLQISTICKKDWLWRKPPGLRSGHTPTARRRDSAASSVGAASVRRLLQRAPPKLPQREVRRFTLLCAATGLCASALLPFTALLGAERGAIPLALMHAIAALVSPMAPLLLQKAGARVVISAGHALVCVLMSAHAMEADPSILWPLYAICGCTLSPLSLALCVSANSLAQTAGDEGRRRVVLRRATRALRAAHDIGLVMGALVLGAALALFPQQTLMKVPTIVVNASSARWPPGEEVFLDDEYEVRLTLTTICLFIVWF